MIATLARSGTSFAVNDKRYFDVCRSVAKIPPSEAREMTEGNREGDVEYGAGTGQPSQRYCANLGHVEDEESDPIYMRARYYEPWSGRIISEDQARAGFNWFTYCKSDPVTFIDESGKVPKELVWIAMEIEAMHAALTALVKTMQESRAAFAIGMTGLLFLASWFYEKDFDDLKGIAWRTALFGAGFAGSALLLAKPSTPGAEIANSIGAYMLVLLIYFIGSALDDAVNDFRNR